MRSLLFFPARLVRWLDTHKVTSVQAAHSDAEGYVIPWPFIFLNHSVLTVFLVGWSWTAVAAAAFLYFLRMFAITGFYHRYLSHRSYKTSRWFQFAFAFLGNMSAQRGPLWWAAHHRHHHRFSDTPEDPHSPAQKGFWNSHMLWWSRRKNIATRTHLVPDLAKYPELVFLDRYDSVAPVTLGFMAFGFGALLERFAPGLGTTGPQMLVWCVVISTVVLFHGVATINSLSHVFGSRRYATADDSRNNLLLAFVTLGEGWHNNHHHYQNAARQGFFWWEIDITYYGLKLLEKLGLVWDLKPVPERLLRSVPTEAALPLREETVRHREMVPEPAYAGTAFRPGVAGMLPGLTALVPKPISARSPDLPGA